MIRVYGFVTGTRVVRGGSGDPNDYTEEYGWVDPDWPPTQMQESRNDCAPVLAMDLDDPELAGEVRSMVSGYESNGEGTYYLPDEHIAEDGAVWTYSVHFTVKQHDPRRGWVEDSWDPVCDGGISLGASN